MYLWILYFLNSIIRLTCWCFPCMSQSFDLNILFSVVYYREFVSLAETWELSGMGILPGVMVAVVTCQARKSGCDKPCEPKMIYQWPQLHNGKFLLPYNHRGVKNTSLPIRDPVNSWWKLPIQYSCIISTLYLHSSAQGIRPCTIHSSLMVTSTRLSSGCVTFLCFNFLALFNIFYFFMKLL